MIDAVPSCVSNLKDEVGTERCEGRHVKDEHAREVHMGAPKHRQQSAYASPQWSLRHVSDPANGDSACFSETHVLSEFSPLASCGSWHAVHVGTKEGNFQEYFKSQSAAPYRHSC